MSYLISKFDPMLKARKDREEKKLVKHLFTLIYAKGSR